MQKKTEVKNEKFLEELNKKLDAIIILNCVEDLLTISQDDGSPECSGIETKICNYDSSGDSCQGEEDFVDGSDPVSPPVSPMGGLPGRGGRLQLCRAQVAQRRRVPTPERRD